MSLKSESIKNPNTGRAECRFIKNKLTLKVLINFQIKKNKF